MRWDEVWQRSDLMADEDSFGRQDEAEQPGGTPEDVAAALLVRRES